jgi:hypothetical protein
VRIVHRDFIGDLVSSAIANSFYCLGFSLNPGMGTFPWLTSVAAAFEKYRFQALRIVYAPRCPTTMGGSVVLCVDFDAADPPPASRPVAQTYACCVDTNAWSEAVLTLPHSRISRELYTRFGSVPSNTDIKTYDIGTLYIGSMTSSTTTNLGSVYLEYELELIEPQASGLLGSSIATGGYNAQAYTPTNPSATAPWGTTASEMTGLNNTRIGQPSFTCDYDGISKNILRFSQPWEGQLTIDATGTSFTSTGPSTLTESTLSTASTVASLTALASATTSTLYACSYAIKVFTGTVLAFNSFLTAASGLRFPAIVTTPGNYGTLSLL